VSAQGKSKKIALADLPPAVSEAVQKKFEAIQKEFKDIDLKDLKLTEADEAKVSGKPGYRVRFVCKTKLANKSGGTMWVSREGKFVHGYRQTNLRELPKPVLEAFVAKSKTFKEGKTIDFINESYSGDEFSFTFGIIEGKKTIEVEFDRGGKLIRNEVVFEDK
jgi:hypothetical protein